MGCCCCSNTDEEPDLESEKQEARDFPGPKLDRRCTDLPWLLVFMIFLLVLVVATIQAHFYADVTRVWHSRDHSMNHCGQGKMAEKKYAYYPRLDQDFRDDPTLQKRYGVCVESCPKPGTLVHDYDDKQTVWYVEFPSVAVARRCIPYHIEKDLQRNVTSLCAWPQCDEAVHVCGLEADGTNRYWLLSEPDIFFIEGWHREHATDAEVQKRVEKIKQYKETDKDQCQSKLLRETRLRLDTWDTEVMLQLLRQFTGVWVQQGRAVIGEYRLILGVGLLGSLLAAALVVTALSFCVRVIVNVLLVILFLSLVILDLYFFYQAGYITGNFGRFVHETLGFEKILKDDLIPDELRKSAAEVVNDEERMLTVYSILAWALAVGIAILTCIILAIQRNLKVLYALLTETARLIALMPSLLLAPFLSFISMSLVSMSMLWLALMIATFDHEDMENFLTHIALGKFFNADSDLLAAKRYISFCIIFSWLWLYFFHMAFFIATTSSCVGRWYFFRADAHGNTGTGAGSAGHFFGRPLLLAYWQISRYHLGSLAFGSLILALAAMPRIILEYIVSQTKADENAVLRCVVWVSRWALWCLQRCLEFLTEYAYGYVAITAKTFCQSAKRSFVLFAEFPVQVAIDKAASTFLTYVACIAVPSLMAVLVYVAKPGIALGCIVAVVALSAITTRLTVRVYDVCCTALFICMCRDAKLHDGKYMPASLARAYQMIADDDETELRGY